MILKDKKEKKMKVFFNIKKVFCIGVFFLLALAGAELSACSEKEDRTRPMKLLVYGDSLSAGYQLASEDSFASKLAEALYKKGYVRLTVLQMSVSGETTSGGLKRLPSALEQKPDAVLLELGVNDFLRQLPLSQARENLAEMIETFQKNGIKVFLIGMKTPSVFPISRKDDLSEMYEALSEKYGVPLYPFFMEGVFPAGGFVLNGGLPLENLQSDGVHPSKKGVEIMVRNILPAVMNFLKEIP